MIAEAIKALVGLGQDAQRMQFEAHEGLPRKVFARWGNDVTVHDVPPPDRNHHLFGFDDLVQACEDPAIAKQPEVYVGDDCVRVLLDRGDRRERVSCALVMSDRLLHLRALQTPEPFEPRDAVKMLRFDLHGAGVDNAIQALSRIDFARTNAGKTDVAHGKESLGRSVEASVQQADKVPETFVAEVPVWTNPGFDRYKARIKVGVYLDLDAQKVELRALSGEIDAAMNIAISSVGNDLRAKLGESVPVFHGKP